MAKQKAAGIDIGNDGEQQRIGFQTYIPQRMSRLRGRIEAPPLGRDYERVPSLRRAGLARRFPRRSRMQNAPRRQTVNYY